ncbi:MAG: hypothetical protein JKX85_11945 [Phycisphaeraceae bacterium]|nr:hypothetical protein [Phycisphaeraceae bacterium]
MGPNFRGPGSLAHYRVDEWILGVGAWVERLKINHADDQVYYQYTSRELEDDTTHTFRVTPVSAGGIDGIARSFVLLMVRRPDVPRVSYTYNNLTGNVTIAAV